MKSDSTRSAPSVLIALVTAAATLPAAAADDTTLEKVTIFGDQTPDYRTQDVQVGPLGPRPVMDLPYSLDVVPDSLSIVQQLKSRARSHGVPFPTTRDRHLARYCSSRSTAPDPNFTTVELPPELAVTADDGLSVLGHREAALRFALFVMSPEAQRLIGLYGFTPVAQSQAAH
jgi:hypothetical protein